MKTAIIYDWLDKWGGVERILLTMRSLFPEAVFYTSYSDKEKAPWTAGLAPRSSFIQRIPSFIRRSRILSLPFYPFAFESFDFEDFDLVISISSSFAKGIITRPGVRHINYLLSPTRYLWIYPELYLSSPSTLFLKPYLTYLKGWDKVAAWRPDRILAISQTVADRCREIYGREAAVVYPPFDTRYWLDEAGKKEEVTVPFKSFYLAVARLEPYKKLDILLEGFKHHSDWNLVIVGEGSGEKKLKESGTTNVLFLKKLSDAKLAHLYGRAEAFIMPQEEDFGYTSLEAQALGCPVVAYHKGGATETVKEGRTGIFFESQTPEAIANTLARLHTISYNLKLFAKREGPRETLTFSRKLFRDQLFSYI